MSSSDILLNFMLKYDDVIHLDLKRISKRNVYFN